MRNNTGKVAVLMGTIGAFLAVLGLAVAVPTTDASPHSPSYCYRLAPQFITSSVTPCTFPCLFISSNVHPHIVVQPELDGTPCHVAPSLHHKTQVGSCRRGVCTVKLRPPVLKRKKRFVCLISLAALIKAKRERKRLKEEMETLRRLTLYNSIRGAHHIPSAGVGNRVHSNIRSHGVRSGSSNGAVGEAIEIHVMPYGENRGIVAGDSGRDISPTFISRNRAGSTNGDVYMRGGLSGNSDVVTNGGRRSSGGYSSLGHGAIGAPSIEETNAGGSIIGGRIGMGGSGGIAGTGASASEVGGNGNFALGNNGRAGSLSGNSGLGVGILGAGITGSGGRNLNGEINSRASISGVVATASRRTGEEGGSAAVVGVVGARTSAHRSGIGLNGESGGFTHEGPDTISRRLVGAGGYVSARGAPNSNNVNVATGAVGATSFGRRSGSPAIGGVNSAFSGTVGSVRGRNVGVSTGSAGATGFAAGNGLGAGTEENSYFGRDVDDSEGLNSDFDDA